MRVEDYNKDPIITDKDEFFGSNGDDNKKTVNFPARSVANYVGEILSETLEGINQNNRVQVLRLDDMQLREISEQGVADYLSNLPTPLIVPEDVILMIEVDVPEIVIQPTLSRVLASLDINDPCVINPMALYETTLYHNGDFILPRVGDRLFFDPQGEVPVINQVGGTCDPSQRTKPNFRTDGDGVLQPIICRR